MSERYLDYIHEDSRHLRKEFDRLKRELRTAEDEREHAARLKVDLVGSIEEAERAVEILKRQIAEITEVIKRVDSGYPYWEEDGFKVALDACGLVYQSTLLSELLLLDNSRDVIRGYDDAEVRIPVSVQESYKQALDSRLFNEFLIYWAFEPEEEFSEGPEGKIDYYLFGTIDIEYLPQKALFFIEQWKTES